MHHDVAVIYIDIPAYIERRSSMPLLVAIETRNKAIDGCQEHRLTCTYIIVITNVNFLLYWLNKFFQKEQPMVIETNLGHVNVICWYIFVAT